MDLIETLLHRALELISGLSISVTVEDAPSLHSRLGVHPGLDLTIKLSGTLLDVELVGST